MDGKALTPPKMGALAGQSWLPCRAFRYYFPLGASELPLAKSRVKYQIPNSLSFSKNGRPETIRQEAQDERRKNNYRWNEETVFDNDEREGENNGRRAKVDGQSDQKSLGVNHVFPFIGLPDWSVLIPAGCR